MLRHGEPLYPPDTPIDQVLLTWALMYRILMRDKSDRRVKHPTFPEDVLVVHAKLHPKDEEDVHLEWLCPQ